MCTNNDVTMELVVFPFTTDYAMVLYQQQPRPPAEELGLRSSLNSSHFTPQERTVQRLL